jgi:hypothetical protein
VEIEIALARARAFIRQLNFVEAVDDETSVALPPLY